MTTSSGRFHDAGYVGAVVATFLPVYLITRSSELLSDGRAFVDIMTIGDVTALHYGEVGHFLQIPLAHLLWRILHASGVAIQAETVLVGLGLAGTLVAIVYMGFVAERVYGALAARWLGAAIFGTSLHAWMFWNGEFYALAFGFVLPALDYTLRRAIFVPAALWALAVLSHIEFAMVAPAFMYATWLAHRDGTSSGWRRASLVFRLPVLAAIGFVGALVCGGFVVGKWRSLRALQHWLGLTYSSRATDLLDSPSPLRAMKGLVTAYTAGAHYVQDVIQGYRSPLEPASVIGAVILLTTGLLIVIGVGRRDGLVLSLAWTVPVHVLFNWRFIPTIEKYHGAALPGFVLLVVGGLVTIFRWHGATGRRLAVGYVVLVAAGNLFLCALPLRAVGQEIARAEHAIRALKDEPGGPPTVVSCDDPRAVVRADVEYLRIRSIWTGGEPVIRSKILAWIERRLAEGKRVYVVGATCQPSEWQITYTTVPFDLGFLRTRFEFVPTSIRRIPLSQRSPTNVGSTIRGDLVQLVPRKHSG